jgi:hypothetical protein
MAKRRKPIRPYTMDRYGILNSQGQIWTCNTFACPADASAYLRNYWLEQNTSKFEIVPVTVTVTCAVAASQ